MSDEQKAWGIAFVEALVRGMIAKVVAESDGEA
jgi:hypothetical protein